MVSNNFAEVGEADRLVRATSQAQALRHVARSIYAVRVASQDDIVGHMESGGKIETANEQLDINGDQK